MQAGKNGKAGQGMIYAGETKKTMETREEMKERKREEKRRGKRRRGAQERPKNERLAEDALAAESPQQRSINGQPRVFSRVFGCCVSGRCFFLSCSSCLILRLLAGTVCHHSPGELVAGRGYVIAIAARSGKREAGGVISVSRVDYVILVCRSGQDF